VKGLLLLGGTGRKDVARSFRLTHLPITYILQYEPLPLHFSWPFVPYIISVDAERVGVDREGVRVRGEDRDGFVRAHNKRAFAGDAAAVRGEDREIAREGKPLGTQKAILVEK